MKIDIWSDIRCPFCYIGKRNLEAALAQFEHKDQVEIVWRSYELDPDLKTDLNTSTIAYLAQRKGITNEASVRMHAQVTQMAADSGLTYNLDIYKVSNSLDAHRLIQFSKTKGLGDNTEEALFKAYFTEGKDISDLTVLLQIGIEIGLDETALDKVLQSTLFSSEVKADQTKANEIGVTGVPFFVFDNKYAISGAQPPAAFLNALETCVAEGVAVNRKS